MLVFHAFFRLGELVVRDKEHAVNMIQRADLTFIKDQGIQINLKYFKPTILSQCKNDRICPVCALYVYSCNFQHKSCPFFTFQSGVPITHAFVSSNLKSGLTFCGFDPTLYKGHSFRIGAATEVAQLCSGHP